MPTSPSHTNWSAKRKASIRRALKRSWQPGGAHYERFRNRPVDADTVRKRALWDRKGLLAGWFSAGGKHYQIIHSRRRTDAFDVVLHARTVFSGGRHAVGRFIAGLLA